MVLGTGRIAHAAGSALRSHRTRTPALASPSAPRISFSSSSVRVPSMSLSRACRRKNRPKSASAPSGRVRASRSTDDSSAPLQNRIAIGHASAWTRAPCRDRREEGDRAGRRIHDAPRRRAGIRSASRSSRIASGSSTVGLTPRPDDTCGRSRPRGRRRFRGRRPPWRASRGPPDRPACHPLATPYEKVNSPEKSITGMESESTVVP